MQIAIIGVGNGGMAMASHLALEGFEVNLYSKFDDELKPIRDNGGIELEEKSKKGFARLNIVTDDIKKALEEAEIILIVTPAFAHAEIAKKSAPYLNENQIVLLNPGRTGGALEFDKILEKGGLKNKPVIGEAQTLIYTCRKVSPIKVEIYKVKKKVAISAFPSKNNKKLIEKLKNLYPQFTIVKNVLETSFNNFGAVLHPAPTLLNIGRIESGQEFDYYHEGITPKIAYFLEKIDLERIKITKALGLKTESVKNYLESSYEIKGKTLYELIQNNKAYGGIKAPKIIRTRYLTEDIPTGLVPIASMARQLEISTPNINSIIEIGSTILNVDYWSIGRTVEKLGIDNLNANQINEFVTD